MYNPAGVRYHLNFCSRANESLVLGDPDQLLFRDKTLHGPGAQKSWFRIDAVAIARPILRSSTADRREHSGRPAFHKKFYARP